MENDMLAIESADFKNIDGAVIDFFKNLKIITTTSNGEIKVPVYWGGAERAAQKKSNFSLRDDNGLLILPQIVITRKSVARKKDWKGAYYAELQKEQDFKGGTVEWTKILNQKKTAEFQRAKGIKKSNGKINFKIGPANEDKIVYEHVSVPLPIYLEMIYSIKCRTEYVTQMNDILQRILTLSPSLVFVVERDGFKYECFLDEDTGYKTNSEDMNTEERKVFSDLTLKVLGYLIGGGKSDNQPKRVIRENAVKISLKESIYDESDSAGSSTLIESGFSGGFSRGFS